MGKWMHGATFAMRQGKNAYPLPEVRFFLKKYRLMQQMCMMG
ncbi:hypothetical protein FLA_2977 [Filimonas lacunae]|nr:hypothetical protein FLA_2977 [Filimonas lacunae]